MSHTASGFFVLRTPLLPFDDLLDLDLNEILSRPEVREAIGVAAPDLDPAAERALVRYVFRMAGRATPFGFFAGISLGTIGDQTVLVLGPRDSYRRVTRLDAEDALRSVEAAIVERREQLTWLPNPSLYRRGDRRRYVHSRPAAAEERHRLVSVRESDALSAVLVAAADGATLGALREALTAPPERAARYVDDLVAQQVLVPDAGLQVTGADATYGLEVEGRLQVDMIKPAANATLGRAVVDELLAGARLLRRIGYRDPTPTPLERCLEQLLVRFEGEPVPLLEALDPDVGVAFDEEPAPAPLLEGITLRNGRSPVQWGPREEHLLARVLEVGAGELVLDQRDLDKLAQPAVPPLPDAFGVQAIVAARSTAALNSGRFRVLVLSAGGPSGARLLGRYCHADPALQAAVEAHLRAEEALEPDAVFAEVVHVPGARDVNVIARPVLREYEIPCFGRSGAPAERQLALSDLLLSVQGGEAVLHSRRLGRRVIPRLTSAHNFSQRGVAVYRFLCALQGPSGPDFWGPLAPAPYLPRVRAGRIVLARAQYTLTRESRTDPAAFAQWRADRRVPRWVALADSELPVDLENPLAVESLLGNEEATQLVELFPQPDELCVRGPEGAFAHELVVPFVRSAPAPSERRVIADRVPRRFPPGSEWVYARLYTGETLADAVLTGTLAPLVRELGVPWFFLRYGDPEFHLRVRLEGAARPAVEAATRRLVEEGLVWRVEFGTYQREAERYGGPAAITSAEAAFHADSEAVVAILALLEPGAAGLDERWRIGLAGTHALLADLGFDLRERIALLRRWRDGVARRDGWDASALATIGVRYRRERAELAALLAAEPADGHPLEPGLAILRTRSERLRALGAELQRLDRAGRLTASRATIAISHLHMHLNRLLRGDNAAQEVVIADLLARLYEAELHRSRD